MLDGLKQKKTFEVEIAGQSMKIKTLHDEATVRELVAFVNQKIGQALPLTKSGSLQNASILACLNMAEELILLKRKTLEELDKVEAKARRVISSLESSREHSANLDH